MRIQPLYHASSFYRSISALLGNTTKPNTIKHGIKTARSLVLLGLIAVTTTTLASTVSSAGSLKQLMFGLGLSRSAGVVPRASQPKAAVTNPMLAAAMPDASSSMTIERRGHTATLLADGRVLIVGGENSGGLISQSEIYDPTASTFSVAANLNSARADHSATRLADGRVLIAGGRGAAGALNTTEIFDPTTGAFASGPALSVARAGHSATLFADGRILFAGGDGDGSAEILDVSAASSAAVASLGTARSAHSAALLQDGRVVIVGGRDAGGNELSSVEIFDTTSSTFSTVDGALQVARVHPHLRVLFDGKVQIIGGSNDGSMEIYDPAYEGLGAYAHVIPESDTCAGLPGQVLTSQTRAALFHNGQTDPLFDRTGQTITEMNGQALVLGGVNSSGTVLNSSSVLTSSAASITTDVMDYSPGETASITGRGFQPGETVRVKIHEDPHTPQERGFDAVADANGNFSGEYLVQDYDLDMKFIVGARGLTSGATAQTTFTDARNWDLTFAGTGTGSVTITPNSGTINAPTTCGGTGTNAASQTVTSVCSPKISTSDNNAVLTFNASPTGGSTFGGWSAATNLSPTTCTGTTNPCTGVFTGNGSLTITFTASAAVATTLTLAPPSPASAPFGSAGPVTLSATLTRTTGGAAVVGATVNFTVDASSVGSAVTNGSGVASITTYNPSALTVGGHTIQASSAVQTISGTTYAASTSGAQTLTVTKANQTISFGALGNKTYGDAPFTVSATGGASGNPVTFASSPAGVCTSSGTNGSTITIVGAGNCSVTASQAGNGNYNAATDVPQTFTVNQKTLTASITGDPTKPYDGNNNATLTSANFSLSGLVGSESFTVTKNTGSYNSANVASATTVTTSLIAGDFTAGAGTLASNYNLPTTASGAGHITAVTLTASIIGNPTKPYDGNTAATLTSANFSLATLVGSESFTVTKTTGSYNSKDVATATTVTTSLIAGDFTTGAGTLASNYNLPTTASGAGHITAVTLTASITGDPTKPYDGNTNATLTNANFSLAGLVGSESFTVTKTTGSYNSKDVVSATTVTTSLVAGDFTAGAGTLASNYNLPTTASGAGHITAVTLTASIIGNPTKTYDGNTNAALTSANFSLATLVASETFTVTKTIGSYNSADVASATTVTTSLAAGDFTAGAGTLAGNYNLPTTASGAGQINKANATVVVTPYTVTYDGNAHTATYTINGVNGESGATVGSVTLNTTHTNAGTYSSDSWSFTGAGNYNDIASTTITDTINKANATVVVTPYNVTYDANPHTATYTITGVGTDTAAAGGSINVSGTTHTAAGTYNGDAWSFTGGTNYNDQNGTVDDAINKANATVVVTPYSVTYDANSHTATHTITGVGGQTGATVGTVDVSNTTHTDAGTYSSDSWSFTGTANYNNIAATTITDTISKANATVVVMPYNVTYDANPHTATYTITGVGTDTAAAGGSINVSATTHTAAGTYNGDAWSFTGGTNYNDQNSTVDDFIGKANATVVVTPYNVTYDANPHTATYTITGVGTDTAAAGSSINVSGTTHTAAGTYNGDAWSFTGGTNYNDQNNTVNDVIGKALATVVVTHYNVTYDANPHTATYTITGVGTDTAAAGSSINVSGTTHTAAGTYNGDAWSFTGGANYNDANGTVDDNISQAASTTTIDCSPGSFTYTGSAITPCTATVTRVGDPNTTTTVTYANNVNVGAATADAGYGGDANHTGSTATQGTFAITQAASTTAIDCSPGSFTYTGSAITPCTATVTRVGDPNTTTAVSYANNTNVGTATADASYAGDANHTGSTATQATFAITQAASTTTIDCSTGSFTYTGSAITPCTATVTRVGDANTTTSVTYANNVNVGSATADAAYAGDLNHTGSTATQVSFSITQATSTTAIDCSPGSFTYTGSPIAPCTATVTRVGDANTTTAVTYANNLNVGTATADASYAGDANHTGSTATQVSFAIAKRPLTVSISGNPTKTYDGNTTSTLSLANYSLGNVVSGQSITVTKTTGSYNTKDVLTANTVSTTLASGDFTAGVGTNLNNYNLPTSASGPGHITAKALSITADNKSMFFGGTAPTFTATDSGYVVGESRSNLSGTLAFTAKTLPLPGVVQAVNATTPVGTYAIIPSGLTSSNYQITFNDTGRLTVGAWTLNGFYQPVGIPNTYHVLIPPMSGIVWNSIKGGQTVPLKFNVFAGTAEQTLVSAIAGFAVQEVACVAVGTTIDDVDFVTTGATQLRYDGTSGAGGQFIQNWQTPNTANKCYRTVMTTSDSSVLVAFFMTKK